MKKIYGNEFVLSTLEKMVSTGRTAHSLIFYGEKGSGRKLMADRYAAQLLCEQPISGAPCGICNACKNVEKHSHPDVTYVRTEGKLEGYTAGIAREVISDAFIKPNNNTGRKVYIFRDCRKMAVQTQNMLLKLIEEPPDYAFFIFTAESKYEFLPTVISRCVSLGLSPCTEEEAEQSLIESGHAKEDISDAVSCFHGNIGMCESFINDESLRKQVDLTKRLADSIIKKDEYGLNAELFSLGSSRSSLYSIMGMLDKVIRDAAVLGRDSSAAVIGCSKEAAVRLSQTVTPSQAEHIHRLIERARESTEANVSIPLVLAALSAEIIAEL